MKQIGKKISVVLLLLLLALGLLLWKGPKAYSLFGLRAKLASFTVPDSLLAPIGERGLFPGPLRKEGGADSVLLTRSGVIVETNLQRTNNALPILKENAQLNKVAATKLADMFKNQYFEHVSPSGIGPSDLANRIGYKYVIVGENLALGNFANDKDLVQAWMDSPGHRENILHPRFTEIGVAVGKGQFEGRQVWLAVQSFGAPLSSCPAPSETLQQQIAADQSLLRAGEQELAAMREDLDNEQNKQEYNRKVSLYNQKVTEFNALVEKTKVEVATYNAQVNSFNKCVNGE